MEWTPPLLMLKGESACKNDPLSTMLHGISVTLIHTKLVVSERSDAGRLPNYSWLVLGVKLLLFLRMDSPLRLSL